MIGTNFAPGRFSIDNNPLIAQLLAKIGAPQGTGLPGPVMSAAPAPRTPLQVLTAPMSEPPGPMTAAAVDPAAMAPHPDQRSLADIMAELRAPQVDISPAPEAAIPAMSMSGEEVLANSPQPMVKKPGFFDNLRAKLNEPGMSAALFRSGAATLNGGLGAGLEAGANYMDNQKAMKAKSAQQAFDNAIATGRLTLDALTVKQKNDLALMGINVDKDRNTETVRHNKAGEAIDVYGKKIQKYGIDKTAETSTGNNVRDNITSRTNNHETNATSASNNAANNNQSNTNNIRTTTAAGIGSKSGGYTDTVTIDPGAPAGWTTPARPKTKTTTRVPMAAPGVAALPSEELRYDVQGNAYRRDPVTGQPVRVNP